MKAALRRFPGKRAKDAALALLYPRASHCLCCDHPRLADEEDCLCDDCRRRLNALRVTPEACDRCLSPVKRGRPCAFCNSPMMKPIRRVYAPYRYAEEVRALIHAFKFRACDEARPLLSAAMASSLKETDFDCVTPVPLHPRRLRDRGFNQAELLALDLAESLRLPLRTLLRRDVYHGPQSRLPMGMRPRNVSRAFSCAEDPSGLRVLLVDDVRTSGSTAHACAKALMNAGAESVCLCVAAVVYRKK